MSYLARVLADKAVRRFFIPLTRELLAFEGISDNTEYYAAYSLRQPQACAAPRPPPHIFNGEHFAEWGATAALWDVIQNMSKPVFR